MASHSVTERRSLADALLAAGPDAPTLCEGWDAHDLAAHLVSREWRPDAGLALLVPPLRGWGESVRAGYRAQPFEDVVRRFASGPPRFGWSGLPKVDATLNLVEFAVHEEDVRRGRPGFAPRELPADLDRALWHSAVRTGRFFLRRSPVSVQLAWPAQDRRTQVRPGTPVVTIAGEPIEVLLFCYGRTAAADVELTGPDDAVAAVRGLDLGV